MLLIPVKMLFMSSVLIVYASLENIENNQPQMLRLEVVLWRLIEICSLMLPGACDSVQMMIFILKSNLS